MSTPSPMHAPATTSREANAVMSWQPVVVASLAARLPPSGNSTGVDARNAPSGALRGIFTTLIASCGG